MRIRFKGGPWDGVSIDAPLLPDQVRLKSLAVELGVEAQPAADSSGDACYWLRTPYDRKSYYEHDARCSEAPA